MAHKLVVGLGNPGPEYERTWHNLGFHVVRQLATRLRVSLRLRDNALTTQTSFLGNEVTLLLPQDYMNLSGNAVRRFADRNRVDDEDILIVYDDHDLPRGLVRLRPRGGDGGHRGMRSILREMNTNGIPRMRIGIRDDSVDETVGGYDDLADRVLDPLEGEELEQLETIADKAARIIQDWLRHGSTLAMNRHNNSRLWTPPKPPSDESRD